MILQIISRDYARSHSYAPLSAHNTNTVTCGY